jgi:hypothetical protein
MKLAVCAQTKGAPKTSVERDFVVFVVDEYICLKNRHK